MNEVAVLAVPRLTHHKGAVRRYQDLASVGFIFPERKSANCLIEPLERGGRQAILRLFNQHHWRPILAVRQHHQSQEDQVAMGHAGCIDASASIGKLHGEGYFIGSYKGELYSGPRISDQAIS